MKSHPVVVAMLILAAGLAGWVFIVHPQSGQEALFYQSELVSVPDGTLIRSDSDEQVYYAVDGHKRWIDSAATFEAQGFMAGEVHTLTATELARYPDGEPITALTRLVLPREQKVMPDLAPLAPYDLRLALVAGRTVIRFTGSFWNKGYRPFQLMSVNQKVAGTASEAAGDIYQLIGAEDDTVRKKYVGTFIQHPTHNHLHVEDFAEYLFEPVRLDPGSVTPPSSLREKTTFCMRDDERMPADIPNVPEKQVFTDCGPQGQGVSPGWIDVYVGSLPGQYVDVNDLPPGIYALSFHIDPLGRLVQERGDNDIATTLVELDVRRRALRVIGSFSPFPTLRNHISDGTLIRDSTNGNIYVVGHNRKRWLRNEDVFNSYGYDWSSVYPVTHSMADAVISQQLIRQQGTVEVFIVDAQGYARHILNPLTFASYGFSAEDIGDINGPDFASYPRSELIMRPGDAEVYRIDGSTKHAIGTLVSLQQDAYDLSGLQVVTQTDFDGYATR